MLQCLNSTIASHKSHDTQSRSLWHQQLWICPPQEGCVNDAHNVRDLLIANFGFRPEEIHTLEDEQVVKTELFAQWDWLTSGARPGDILVFHFSGHGSYVPDESGEEPDLRDEITCLQDMDFNDPATYLTDDEWYELAQRVDPAVQLIILKDTCHSGGSARFLVSPQAPARAWRGEVGTTRPTRLAEVPQTSLNGLHGNPDGRRCPDRR
jgi:hypothetical protein